MGSAGSLVRDGADGRASGTSSSPGTRRGGGGLTLRVAFLGTPADAVPALEGLVAADHEVALVVTRPDARRSRRSAPEPSPVKVAAARLGLRLAEDPGEVTGAGVELGVVVAYGRLLRPPLLGGVPLVNVHFSLLPRWRGAAPVERAILAGDTCSGVCLMEVVEQLDAGPLYRRVPTPIGPEETAAELRARLAGMGGEVLVAALEEGLGEPAPQEGEVTYAAKLAPEERRLDWARAAEELVAVVRVGRAWTTVEGKRLLVLDARAEHGCGRGVPGDLDGTAVTTGSGRFRLVRVQPEGRPPLDAAAWLRGARDVTRLGS